MSKKEGYEKEQYEKEKKPNIWFRVHWLAEHTSKSTKDQFSKPCRLASEAIWEEVKINSETS